MGPDLPPILIAASRSVITRLARALADEVRVIGVETWQEALRQLEALKPNGVIVCYLFDEMRPFRLLHHLRHEYAGRHVPTFLVRAVPVSLGTTNETEIGASYRMLGVDEFINLHDEEQASGRAAALQRFRNTVLSRVGRDWSSMENAV